MIALVGTLAAFAALGRIAFAALPNVKPTTDIVLIAGYALGGAPGFVVGALAGLTSNFFFGQGPWTPWQMAAWAGTGALGGALAFATGRKLGRWLLAAVCAGAGFAFTVVQDVGDWVNYSDHSLAQLGVYVGKGIGFDAVHAGGCLVFALAFGPALARSLARFAARLQVTWQPAASVLLAFALLSGAAAPDHARAAATPAGYLRSAQNADGGVGAAPGTASSELFSGWAALGLAAAGENPGDVRHGARSLIDYILSSPPSDVGALERTIIILRASGLSAASQLSALQGRVRRDGSVAHQVNLTSFAVLALRAAGLQIPRRTLIWLVHQQDSDGGFNFATAGGVSDVDDTGAALEALAASHQRVTSRAVRFIESQQNPDGGFPADPGGDSNAQSTSWAVQGLLAAGAGSGSVRRALAYLRALTAPDGHVRYSRSSDQTPVWVTAQAAQALAGKPLPLAPVPRTAAPSAGPSPRAHSTAHSPAITPPARSSSPPTGAVRGSARRRVRPPQRAMPRLDPLAVDAAVLTALALAPLEVG